MRLLLILLSMVFFAGCSPISSTSSSAYKTLRLDNRTYEPNIKSVALFPISSTTDINAAFLEPAVTVLNSSTQGLILEFDDLNPNYERYFAKIIHCNADWTKSGLRDLEFLTDYNEFPLQDFAFSQNTRTAYVHYTYPVPRVNIPGNYVLTIYRDGNENDLVLTHRFMVVQNKVSVGASLERSLIPGQRETMQRVTVDVDYSAMEIPNPMTQLKVVIRQNRRWDQIATPSPTQIRQGQQRMVYAPLDEQLDFQGGNEFRWFETRNVNFAGQNVNNIVLSNDRVDAYLIPERTRGGLAYGQIPDINGAYQPRIQGDFGKVEGDYMYTNFLILSDSLPGNVYVVGAFNSWRADQYSRLKYDQKEKGYSGTILLKQGWYNYQYLYKGDPSNPWFLEGSHFATENIYEVMVYCRPLGSIQDQLIGYTQLRVNPF